MQSSNEIIVRNIMAVISYNGSKYHGWQVQKNALTVQEIFQKKLYEILNEQVDIKGCSRTDSGVHANVYVISFKTTSKITCGSLINALNSRLPDDICISRCEEVPTDFHARYSCIAKEYVYKIWNNKIKNPFLEKRALHYWYPIDISELNKAAKYFLGTHNFTSFATLDARKSENMTRTIYEFDVTQQGSLIEIKIKADGFLYNMVRIIVGTLLRIAQGKFSPDDIPKIIKAQNRKNAGPTAPSHGLYLNKICYNKPIGEVSINEWI